METKILFPLLELFNSVFKALNLFLSKYVAEIQLSDNGIRLLSIPPSSVMAWHVVISITSRKEENAAAVESS
jgi:hypothetical protein